MKMKNKIDFSWLKATKDKEKQIEIIKRLKKEKYERKGMERAEWIKKLVNNKERKELCKDKGFVNQIMETMEITKKDE